jgi:DNA-directed RNA polymerase subunit beta
VLRDLNKIKQDFQAPDLLDMQRKSFNWLLEKGIQELLNEFEETDTTYESGKVLVRFLGYEITKPKATPDECKVKGKTYNGELNLSIRLTNTELGEEIHLQDKNKRIAVGEFPYMTPTGSFIINGVERVVVGQLTRSPGVYFEQNPSLKTGEPLYKATIIPDRGSWIEFETNENGVVFVFLDKRSKKLPATVVLRAMGLTDEELREALKDETVVELQVRSKDYFDAVGKKLYDDIYDLTTGEDLYKKGTILTLSILEEIAKTKITRIHIYDRALSRFAIATLEEDNTTDEESAKKLIFLKLRPGERYTKENADIQFKQVLTDPQRNDLGEVGRYKMNKKLDLNIPDRTVTQDDLLKLIQYFAKIEHNTGQTDNRDHLGNKRLRLVGELLKNNMRVGLHRVMKNTYEKISVTPWEEIHKHTSSIINPRPLEASIKEFFSMGQLSQFMDETNPIASLTHKRRISALGPGGLHRERAGAEVRDVHYSHYGRICPIETPEGENVGLINSLSVYSKIDDRGFIVATYKVVENGKVTDKIVTLTADDEDDMYIAQFDTPVDKHGNITANQVLCRYYEEYLTVPKEKVNLIDISPLQVFSVSAGLIAFLEHDDANRALMGCNMQHQAVPLIHPEIPYSGTGLEEKAAIDSGASELSPQDGIVSYVDSKSIFITSLDNSYEQVQIGKFNASIIDKVLAENITNIGNVGQPIDGNLLHKLFYNQHLSIAYTDSDVFETIDLAELVLYEKNEALIGRKLVTDVYTKTNKVLINAGREITKGLMDRLIGAKIPEVEVVGWTGGVERVPVFEVKYVHKDNIPVERILVYSDPYCPDIEYGKQITPIIFTKLKENGVRSITLVSLEDLKFAQTFILNPKLKKTVILAKDVYIDGKVSAQKGDTVDFPLIIDLVKHNVEVIDIFKSTRIPITKFRRTNQDTVVNKYPLVTQGDILTPKTTIINGEACDRGRLALGQNLLTAYLPWRGYNYQDAIVISQRLVEEDTLTSIHIKEHKVQVRDTKVGPQEITRDIPNVPEEQLRNLDEDGVIRVGTEVGPNDILVGKITPKAESEFTPEMKLWRAMFDKKGQDVKDSSLRVPPGDRGTVIDVQILSRENEENLPIGVNRIVKVFIGEKRKIQIGDKLSGRHGNKGVISKILPVEDMPFLEDGKPVDIVLNPLGVPSRMNVGQILECLLGIIANNSNSYCVTTPFAGMNPAELIERLEEDNSSKHGKRVLYDGYTGETFEKPVTVGYSYIMKLNHMVEDKIHARSIGPYALITQQPLGGKAQFGGQRFGEMEVWALEAYGAAYTLNEMLTIKSDDTEGRVHAYEAICNRHLIQPSSNPESFNVIINELKGLGIKMEVVEDSFYDDDKSKTSPDDLLSPESTEVLDSDFERFINDGDDSFREEFEDMMNESSSNIPENLNHNAKEDHE